MARREHLIGSRANMNPDQICWAAKADEILGKPADQINSDDGRALQAREVCTRRKFIFRLYRN